MDDGAQEVLSANEAFYRVFGEADADRLVAMLADREDLEVMHPGWPPVRGRSLVIRSWRDVAVNPPPIRLAAATVHMLTPDAAVVTCYECIEESSLAATNVWVREPGGWRLLHHQAGPSVREADVLQAPSDLDIFH